MSLGREVAGDGEELGKREHQSRDRLRADPLCCRRFPSSPPPPPPDPGNENPAVGIECLALESAARFARRSNPCGGATMSAMSADVTTKSVVEIDVSDAGDDSKRRPIRIGAVSFLNTLPLIDGLSTLRDVDLKLSVPSLLLDSLLNGETDIALCSSIDYQRSPEPLVIIPAGVLACAGPTLTVRLYSTKPIETIEEVYCDTDSHTSIALMQILLAEKYNIKPHCIDYEAREHVAHNKPVPWPDAMLLIGDKVVTDSPPAVRYPHQLDLGELWHELTGLPFVFATWMAKRSNPLIDRLAILGAALDRQRRHNRMRLDQIIGKRAENRGWPADLAREYLKQRLTFDLDEHALAGLELFYDKSHRHGLITNPRPVEILQW